MKIKQNDTTFLNLDSNVPPVDWMTSSWISIEDRPTHMTEPTSFRSMSTLIGFLSTILSTEAVTNSNGRVVKSSSEQCWRKENQKQTEMIVLDQISNNSTYQQVQIE